MNGTVLVTGGTGRLGREVVRQLRESGRPTRVASRSQPGPVVSQQDWARVDYRSGSGLLTALGGVDTVIHCASGSARGERESIDALLEAARRVPTPPHLIYISIVGIEQIPLGYYRAKLRSEHELESSDLPFSSLRATQFHSLVAGLLRRLSTLPVVLLPRGLRFQPIAIPVVARRLVELAAGAPAGFVPDLGGPEVCDLPDLARGYLAAAGKSRRVVEVFVPGEIAGALRAGANLTPDHAVPGPTFTDYLAVTVSR